MRLKGAGYRWLKSRETRQLKKLEKERLKLDKQLKVMTLKAGVEEQRARIKRLKKKTTPGIFKGWYLK